MAQQEGETSGNQGGRSHPMMYPEEQATRKNVQQMGKIIPGRFDGKT